MTDDELLFECKKGLSISNTAFDSALLQKVQAVKWYMRGSGVVNANMDNPLATALIVIGVTDLWNLNSGEIKFSSAFHTLVNQLACSSPITEVTS